MRPLDTIRGAGRPLAYYPAMAKHVGGITAAIFLGQLMYWDERTDNELGVYKSMEQWEEETGLSHGEQRGARKKLRDLGLLVETNRRLEHRIYYKLDHDAFNAFFESAFKEEPTKKAEEEEVELASADTESPQLTKAHLPNAEIAVGEQLKPQLADQPNLSSLIDTETTTETTTEITCDSPKRSAYSKSFNRFWTAYPNTSRRVAKSKCFDVWKRKKLDAIAGEVVDHVKAMAKTKQWREGYEPAPLTYLNQDRWEDGLPTPQQHTSPRNGGSALYDQNMAAAEEAKRMLFGDDDETV